ncbi:hypothetical protein [Stratiformator vulcanicus]|uniref:Uncharacterized protein n=1 Tax=Stratiformator vulcanicus TaxID=2527980 RepID=A0A517QXX6_9PLAN|nr:hypothetical protein [Stratiformator vulcanicus]QDT36499.1 hypothetical protein Pan189_08560 [Stratiformator vulcanicus]
MARSSGNAPDYSRDLDHSHAAHFRFDLEEPEPIGSSPSASGRPISDAELRRREQAVIEQLSLLEQEQRRFRLEYQSTIDERGRHEARMKSAELDLKRRSDELDEKFARCDEFLTQVEQQQRALEEERRRLDEERDAAAQDAEQHATESLEEQKKRLEAELKAETAAEREELRARKDELDRKIAEQDSFREKALAELRQGWDSERAELRRQLTSKLIEELDADRKSLVEERERFEARCAAERGELEHERELQDRALQQSVQEVERLKATAAHQAREARAELDVELQQLRDQAEAELQADRNQWQEDRDRFEETVKLKYAEEAEQIQKDREEFEQYRSAELERLESERQSSREQIAEERERWHEEHATETSKLEQRLAEVDTFVDETERQVGECRAKAEAEIAEQRQRAQAELDAARSEQDEELADRRAAFEREMEARQTALTEEREVMENRFHFREQHLEKTRTELELARDELSRRLQAGQTYVTEAAEQHRLRYAQLQRMRDRLDERERSLEREKQVLAEMRRVVSADREAFDERAAAEDTAWKHRRESDQAEMLKRRDVISAHEEELAARRSRLDRLKEELDRTHRENLELRVAAEEAWVKFNRAAGPDESQRRIAAARKEVGNYIAQQEQSLAAERERVSAERDAIESLVTQHEEQRRVLAHWYRDREEALVRRDAELRRQTDEARTIADQWSSAQQHWLNEKSHAEKVIRDLISQVETGDDPARLPEPPAAEQLWLPPGLTLPQQAGGDESVASGDVVGLTHSLSEEEPTNRQENPDEPDKPRLLRLPHEDDRSVA